MNVVTLTLDLNKKPTNQHIYISNSDYGAPEVHVYITDNGRTLTSTDLYGYTKRLFIRNPDGGFIRRPSTSMYASGLIVFALSSLKPLGAGETFGYVELSKSDQILSTARFAVTILDEAEV